MMGPRNDPEVDRLVLSIQSLEGGSRRKRLARHITYNIQGNEITSWRFSEFQYKKDPCPFPTLARGLFTVRGSDGSNRILLRGYDKFFNIGEVKRTSWSAIEQDTCGPYELTVKENGCLILASALDPQTLVVTSKHAIDVPHSEVGKQWLRRHLEAHKRSEAELASFLFENNVTAVFELCDDSFEEHILEYTPEERGLYLHGINRNSVQLDTWPSGRVTEIAEQFGFRKTGYYTFMDLTEARAFADAVRSEHSLQGRAIEGFVIRCRDVSNNAPFMFKIKYDEPYLLYREWREVTRQILGKRPYKCRYELTKGYANWVKAVLHRNPQMFAEFNNNKGIIAARKRFLEYHREAGGDIEQIYESLPREEKVLIVPIATIACGKTTLALVLSELFGFGHVQNDNITAKKRGREAFHKAIIDELEAKQVVFADRNNHLGELRETLAVAIKNEFPSCRIIALYWDHSGASTDAVLKTAVARVRQRGEFHQSLTPKTNPNFDRIILKFLRDFEPLDQDSHSDGLIDDVIELHPLNDIHKNIQIAIDELYDLIGDKLPPRRPTREQIECSLENAKNYCPTVKKVVAASKRRREVPIYFGLHCTTHVPTWLAEFMGRPENAGLDKQLYQHLTSSNLIPESHHVTLVHELAAEANPYVQQLFEKYVHAWNDLEGKGGQCVARCRADYLAWDADIMALRVCSMDVVESDEVMGPIVTIRGREEGGNGAFDRNATWQLACGNNIPHVTIGQRQGVRAVQAGAMLQRVFGQNNPPEPLTNLPEQLHVVPVDFVFNAVLKKFIGSSKR
ncbi:trna ligase [Spiromyces aspiralis]|uniref:Trna ligase n=1 Tax=Spiromyces aspiralis TaxID=68401 RepID=A0ACC1HE14_9FUNG|nr:trna ligase [Spiromyces aspiralis]